MRDAEEWAREWVAFHADHGGITATPLAFLILAARREGAEDMREKNAEWVLRNPNASAWETAQAIRALPLPGDE